MIIAATVAISVAGTNRLIIIIIIIVVIITVILLGLL